MTHSPKITKQIAAMAAAFILLLSVVASAGTIAESPHDFRGYQWSESGQICTPCHTPHQTKALPLPLWNHVLATDTFATYSSADPVQVGAPEELRSRNSSKMCLSCHDGTVAPETFGDVSDGSGCLHRDAAFAGDVGSDHPVSFVYDTSLALSDGGLYDPATKLSGVVDSTGTISDDMLFDGRMECSSCHDVHNTRAVAETKLLLKDNAGSGLCLTCHDK